jgi:hypothetical protein
MNNIYFGSVFLFILIGCGQNEPPPINSKQATLDELKSYQQTNCQEKFKMHPFCVDVQNEKAHKTNEAMRRKPGALGTLRTPEEIFGKRQSGSK